MRSRSILIATTDVYVPIKSWTGAGGWTGVEDDTKRLASHIGKSTFSLYLTSQRSTEDCMTFVSSGTLADSKDHEESGWSDQREWTACGTVGFEVRCFRALQLLSGRMANGLLHRILPVCTFPRWVNLRCIPFGISLRQKTKSTAG